MEVAWRFCGEDFDDPLEVVGHGRHARVRSQQLLIELVEVLFELGLERVGYLHGFEQASPELRSRGELVVRVAERSEVEDRDVLEEFLEVDAPRSFSRERLALEVKELPLGVRDAGYRVEWAGDAEDDDAASADGVELDDVIERGLELLRPLARLALFKFDVNANGWCCLGVGYAGREVDVMFRESRALSSPPPREGDADSVENRGLADVIRTDEDGSRGKDDVAFLMDRSS